MSSVQIIHEDSGFEPTVADDPRTPADAIEAGDMFRPGDLVEHKFLSEPLLSVFVRSVGRGRALCYTDRGSWVVVPAVRPLFSAPRFANPADLQPLLPYASFDGSVQDSDPALLDVPRPLGARLLSQMQAFRRESKALFRQHVGRLDDSVAILARGEAAREIHLTEAACILLGVSSPEQLSQVMLYTVHKLLTKSQNVVWNAHTHRKNPIFTILDQDSSNQIHDVRDWLRNPRRIAAPLASFIKKARTIVLASRKSRAVAPSGFIGPCTHPGTRHRHAPQWNSGDRTVLLYLDAWAKSQTMKNSELSSIGPLLLRATGLYKDRILDCNTGFTFLQELGNVAPWQDRRMFDPSLNVCGYSRSITQSAKAANAEASLWQPHDRMAAQRKDWGDLPVYCIDSAETKERDDGLSIEMQGDQTWVHVHVANPSAFVDPESALMRFAAKMGQSFYLPSSKQAMIPPDLSSIHFSLESGRPCLTFSASIDSDGSISSKTISHGHVHNVYHVTPEQLARDLDHDHHPLTITRDLLKVGSISTKISNNNALRQLTNEDKGNLRKLREISQLTARRRCSNGALDFQTSFETEKAELGNCIATVSSLPDTFDTDPAISVQAQQRRKNNVDDLVSGLMILAGEICARWCQERNIAIPYRGMRRNPAPPFSPQAFREQIVDKDPNVEHVRTYMRAMGHSDLSPQPLEHFALGLPCYARATSPLRRFSDILAHWQIEAALTRKDFPFEVRDMTQQCRHLAVRSLQARYVESRANTLWCLQALFRAFYFEQAELPDLFQVLVIRNELTNRFVHGRLLGWGLPVYLNKTTSLNPQLASAQTRQVWNARLENVNLYSASVVLQPVSRSA